MSTKNVVTERSGSAGELITLAFPIIITFISHSIMHVADTYIIGMIGTAEQGGVGLAGGILWIMQSLFIGMLSAITTFVAQYLGAGKTKELSRWVYGGMCFIPIMGLAFWVSSRYLHELADLMKTNESVRPHLVAYLTILFYGAPLFLMSYVFMAFFRGVADMFAPMVITLVSNLINIALNIVFVFGYFGISPMGVHGVALATVISMGVSMLLYAYEYFKWKNHERYETRGRPDFGWKEVSAIFKVGLPIGLSWFLENFAFTLMGMYIGAHKPEDLAAHTIVCTINSFGFMPSVAISITTTTLVGQYLGAKRKDLARKIASRGILLSAAYMGLVGISFFVFRRPLIGMFNPEAQVIQIGSSALMIAALFQVFDSVGITVDGIFRGAGYTLFPMIVRGVAMWAIFVPLIFVLGSIRENALEGAWMAAFIGISVQGAIMFSAYFFMEWENRTVIESERPENNCA